jgi:hypothetical protein
MVFMCKEVCELSFCMSVRLASWRQPLPQFQLVLVSSQALISLELHKP